MSGICGIIRFNEDPVKKEEIQTMFNGMKNCGNDAEGIWIDANVGLGHKMLWTTPESLHENQPFFSVDRKQILVADARIDNREELIEQLKIKENEYAVITDVDLILRAYQKWGEKCPKYLVGDYAFVILDTNLKQLFCVRDPMGIKQFYYYVTDDYFVFGSTIGAILADQKIKKSPNIKAIKNFLYNLSLRYEDTFYENIYRLPPAHILKISNSSMLIQRYWFPERIKINKNLTIDEAIDKFNELFTMSVNARLRSAYPVGAHISGGLDSSSVAAVACAEHGKDAITAFSTHYGDLKCDESTYSNAMIDQLRVKSKIIQGDKLDRTERYTVDRSHGEYPDWPGAGLFLDEFPIFEEAKELGIRVLLTGQGGDHLLTGNMFRLADFLKEGKLMWLYNELRYYGFSKKIIKNYIISPLLPSKIKKFLRFILGKKIDVQVNNEDFVMQSSSFIDVKSKKYKSLPLSQEYDLRTITGMGSAMWMSGPSLNLGGYYGIEYRHPFFDKRLIEFTLALPPFMKMEKGFIKALLRKSMGEKLPTIIASRKDKAEFSEVLKKQFDALNMKKDDINEIFKYNIVDEDKFNKDFESFQNNSCSAPMLVWNIILVEKWLQKIF